MKRMLRIFGILLCGYPILRPVAVNADTVTLYAIGLNKSQSFAVPAGTVAKVIYAFSNGGTNGGGLVMVTVASNTTDMLLSALPSAATAPNVAYPILTGPITITLTNTTYPFAALTIETYPATAIATNVPSTAVVIPADTNGPVTIILESSVDLVNWTPALPGTYGTTTTNRFFRVRATR